MIEGKHSIYMQECVGNKRPKNARVNYGVQSSSDLPCKRESCFDVEVIQKCCDDLDSFTWPYGVCWCAWNELIWAGTPSGVAAAICLQVSLELCDFVITGRVWRFGQLQYDICEVFAQLVWLELLSNAKLDGDLLWKQNLKKKRENCVKKCYWDFCVHFHNASTSIYRENLRRGVSILAIGCHLLKG